MCFIDSTLCVFDDVRSLTFLTLWVFLLILVFDIASALQVLTFNVVNYWEFNSHVFLSLMLIRLFAFLNMHGL